MEQLLYVVEKTAEYALGILWFLMIARTVLEWIEPEGNRTVANFLYMVTEPFVIPVRRLFEKLGWGQDSPFDVPYLALSLFLVLLLWIL